MRTSIVLYIFIVFATFPSFAEVRIHCEGSEENLNTYLQIHEILFTQRDTSRVEEFYSDKIISHNKDSGGPGSIVTPDQMRMMWDASKKYDPERILADELILCIEDFVVVRTTINGTDNAPLVPGYPPTGKKYQATATDIYRFENSKVVERWGNADLAFIYVQLGFDLVK